MVLINQSRCSIRVCLRSASLACTADARRDWFLHYRYVARTAVYLRRARSLVGPSKYTHPRVKEEVAFGMFRIHMAHT